MPGVGLGQAEQVLKDAWVASTGSVFQIDYIDDEQDGPLDGPLNDVAGASFQAIAFAAPDLASLNPARDLIAIDGTKVLRFLNGTDLDESFSFDASERPDPGLRFLNTVAVAPDGAIVYSGYSRGKRRFELWSIPEPVGDSPESTMLVGGNPRLTDSVYLDAENTVGLPAPLDQGGLLAAADREVLFFPAGDETNYITLAATRDFPVKRNSTILSVDLIAETPLLAVALSTRQVYTFNLITKVYEPLGTADIDPPTNVTSCGDTRTQLILVRNVGVDDVGARNVVTDACGQTLVYSVDFDAGGDVIDTTVPAVTTVDGQPVPLQFDTSTSLLALAVGEGVYVTCPAGEDCTLTNGYVANIESDQTAELLVLKVNDLCDPRVAVPGGCYDGSSGDLVLNELLPDALKAALAADGVAIVIPSYLFAATPDARFGAVFVKADDTSRKALSTAFLTVDSLLDFAGLGVATRQNDPTLGRGTPVVDLLNNDVVAYAPDDPELPTVRGFEATPVTVDEGSVVIRKRGYSVDIYGLMHDVDAPSERNGNSGGIDTLNVAGQIPSCAPVSVGGQTYTPLQQPDPADAVAVAAYQQAYFLNLVGCLFGDMQSLLLGTDPVQAANTFVEPFRANLIQDFELAGDKLIKALNASIPDPQAGPNQGETNFQSTLVQLDQFYAALVDAPVNPAFANAIVYKNDLIVRTEVLRFNILERLDLSLDFDFAAAAQ